MSRITPVGAMAALFAAATGAWGADPAALFPKSTLAYAEVHDPAAAGPKLASLLKGTPLEDVAKFVHDRRDKNKELRDAAGKPELALLGLLTSPEMLAEAKKLGGVAAGLTGFNDRGEPDAVFVIRTGDSPAAGLAARAFLTLSGTLRRVGEVAGVPVYQYREPSIRYNNNGQPELQNDKPPTDGAHEATFAYTPGLFVAGSSKAAVGEVVNRFLGKTPPDESLASTAGFKEAAAAYRQPGLFFYANVPEFCARYDAANKARGDAVDPDWYAWFKLTANAKAFRSVAGSLRATDSGFDLTLGGRFDPTQSSPLLALLHGTATADGLRHAPKPAVVAVTVPLPAENRAAAVIGFLDAMAKATGEVGRLPGEAVKELEKKYLSGVRDKLLARTAAVTVVVPAKQELPKGAKPLPVVVIHAEDAAAADAWAAFLPQLVGDLAKTAPPAPSSQQVGGVTVFSLPGTGLPWNAALHYAKSGTTLAVGLDRKLVASAVTADSASVFALKAPADAVALGIFSPGQLLRVLGATDPKGSPPAPTAPRFQPNFPGGVSPDKMREDETKALEEFAKALDPLPQATVFVRRAGTELRVEIALTGLTGKAASEVVSGGVEWFDKWLNRHPLLSGFGNDRFRRGDW